jgi:hypothetical protein
VPPEVLSDQLETELEDTRVARTGDGADVGAGESGRRISEVGVVGRVEGFGARGVTCVNLTSIIPAGTSEMISDI